MKTFTKFLALSLMLFFVAPNFLSAQNILCVDRDGSFSNPDIFTDAWQYIQPALDELGYDYDYWEVEDLSLDGPDWLTMTEYSMVFWFTGEVWDGGTTMTDLDEENLAMYLEAFNGRLLLSSQDFLWDRYQSYGTLTPELFPYKYLGVIEVEQDVWNIDTPDTANVVGGVGSFAEGLAFAVQDIFTEEADDGLFIDKILQNQGEALLEVVTPEPTGVAAVQYDAGAYMTIFSTISLASIVNLADRTEFIFRSIGWLHGTTGVADQKMEQSEIIVHPNPASSFVQMGCEETMEEIWITNSTGQIVDYFNTGTNVIEINTSSYSTGIYFAKVKTENGTTVSRLIIE